MMNRPAAKPELSPSAFFCALSPVLAILLANPILDSGVNDDWSYTRTVLDLIRTGHLLYNGWATAMLGWQVYWGALAVKLFGFSFLVLRLSMLPFAGGTAYLLYCLSRRCGLSSRSSLVCSLSVTLSPLFLPIAASFMTDVPAVFFLVVCLYCCIRAIPAQNFASTLVWLSCATTCSVVGGTGRQTVWLGGLVMLPATAWILKSRRGVWQSAAFLWLVTLVSVIACLWWYKNQPYSIPEGYLAGDSLMASLKVGCMETIELGLSIAFFCLPGLAPYLTTLRSVSRPRLIVLCAAVVLLLIAGIALHLHHLPNQGDHLFVPWLGNLVTPSGVMGGGDGLGQKPTVLTPAIRTIMTIVFVVVAFAAIEFFRVHGRSVAALTNKLSDFEISWRQLLLLFGSFTGAYLILLLPRAATGTVFDRYVLPLLPIVLICLLRFYHDHAGTEIPALSFAFLALFAMYGIATTHDFFSAHRAQLSAASLIMSAGTPRTSIEGGFEFDGWTQLEAANYINDSRIRKPKDAYKKEETGDNQAPECTFFFSPKTPAIKPAYYVVFKPLPCLSPDIWAEVAYRTWLPPFGAKVYVQKPF